MSKKKILVTGSAGFIFSNFVRHILYSNKKYDVVSIDRITLPYSLNNIYANKGHTFYIGDVSDKHFVEVVFNLERPDIVIHGAAMSFVDHSIQDADPFIKSNVLGTQVMVDVSKKYDIERFVYISTDEVFGQLKENDPSWTEEAPINPRNPYSASKCCGELIVKAAHYTHGLPYNITRSCNNFGPRQPNRNLIPKIIYSIINNKKMPIYGQGKQIREWIHVFDNCKAIETIIEKAPLNESYNISTGWEISNIELFTKICDRFESGYDLVELIEDPRPGHDFRYSICSDKIRDLGWKPSFSFIEALTQLCSWYSNNKWIIR